MIRSTRRRRKVEALTKHPGCQIFPGVTLGKGIELQAPCTLGVAPRGAKPGERKLVIGDSCIIRSYSVLYGGSILGDRVQTGHGALIREDNHIGSDVSVGSHSVLEVGNRIGSHVRIHSNCFLEMVTIEDWVIIAPNVVFTDDPHPPCPRFAECVRGATVKRLARIGANTTVLPGVVIGENSLVAAGSVVRKDVPEGCVVAGNPARVITRVDQLRCHKGFFKRPYLWPPYPEGETE